MNAPFRNRSASWLANLSGAQRGPGYLVIRGGIYFKNAFLTFFELGDKHIPHFSPTKANKIFMCRGCVFSGLDPKLCCSRGLRTAYVAHNKLCSTI